MHVAPLGSSALRLELQDVEVRLARMLPRRPRLVLLLDLNAKQAIGGTIVLIATAEVVDSLILDQTQCGRPVYLLTDPIQRQEQTFLRIA